MKLFLLGLMTCFLSTQAIACIGVGRVNICRGDIVYPDNWDHTQGARVLRANPRYNTLSIQSNDSQKKYEVHFSSVSVTNLCSHNICANDLVYPADWSHTKGAKVLAINPSTYKTLIISNDADKVFARFNDDLYTVNGCVKRFCPGEIVYLKDRGNRQDARVLGVQTIHSRLLVVSTNSGNVFEVYSHKLRRRRSTTHGSN